MQYDPHPQAVYSCRVQTFRQYLPPGPLDSGGERKEPIVQLWTDSGLRTLAVASIHFKDPRKTAAGIEAAKRLHGR